MKILIIADILNDKLLVGPLFSCIQEKYSYVMY